jgi:anti-sigma28 factor (negative regulator of flagellin synthesis)
MPDLNEQRKKVEELKKKILEQKKQGLTSPASPEPIAPAKSAEPKAPEAPKASETVRVPVQKEKIETVSREETKQEKKTESPLPITERKNAFVETTAKNPDHSSIINSLQAYVQVLRQAWADGSLSKDEEEMLRTLRKSLGVSEDEHKSLQHEIQKEIYQNLIIQTWKQGSMSPQDSEKLDIIREKLGISAIEHMEIEKHARQVLLQKS